MKSNPYANAPRLPEGDTVGIDAVLSGAGPVLLEIGSGRGMFTIEYATEHPAHRVVALELRRKYAALLSQKLSAMKLDNARCYSEDARVALPRIVPSGAVSFVAIHFPDPWWKKRHAKRMVVGDALVTELARLVHPGGLVLVQTDVDTRAEQYLERFGASPCFENTATAGERFVSESPFAPARSNRERRAMQDGLPVYRMAFRRIA